MDVNKLLDDAARAVAQAALDVQVVGEHHLCAHLERHGLCGHLSSQLFNGFGRQLVVGAPVHFETDRSVGDLLAWQFGQLLGVQIVDGRIVREQPRRLDAIVRRLCSDAILQRLQVLRRLLAHAHALEQFDERLVGLPVYLLERHHLFDQTLELFAVKEELFRAAITSDRRQLAEIARGDHLHAAERNLWPVAHHGDDDGHLVEEPRNDHGDLVQNQDVRRTPFLSRGIRRVGREKRNELRKF